MSKKRFRFSAVKDFLKKANSIGIFSRPVTSAQVIWNQKMDKPMQFAKLSKVRLSALVVATSLAGFGMCPDPCSSVGLLGVTALTTGTAMCSFSANAWNQYLEWPYDAQMKRTQSRVLVTGVLSQNQAMTYASVCGVGGTALLWYGVNPVSAVLGASNILLYAGVYTPIKRISVYNTWIGSVVGAIPPVMGWAACSGGRLDPGAFVLAAILYTWQFPHFNALSWNLRDQYSKAGYRMMAAFDQPLCRRTTIRHSLALMAVCSLAVPATQLTTWTFAATSLPLNLYMTYLAYGFYKDSNSRSARQLFRYSLAYLPLLMVLMIASKKSKKKPEEVDKEIGKTKPEVGKENGKEKPEIGKGIGKEKPEIGKGTGKEKPEVGKENGKEKPEIGQENGKKSVDGSKPGDME